MHGGDIYNNSIDHDHSVSLNPVFSDSVTRSGNEVAVRIVGAIDEATKRARDRASDYPDINQTELGNALALYEKVNIENVFAGCGASQLIMAATAAVRPKTALLTGPCFTGYRYALDALGDCRIRYHLFDEMDGFAVNDDLIDRLTDDIDMIFLADPNNPTGKNIDGDLLGRILDRTMQNGIFMVLDESFFELSEGYDRERDALLIEKYPNLCIIRSFTKSFALPGIRMGYAVSSPETIERIRRQLPEWNLPVLSKEVMLVCADALRDGDILTSSMELIRKERGFLEDELKKLGLNVFESDTLFLLVKGPEGLYDSLIKDRILIRKCDDMPPLSQCFYRIAVREHDDNARLVTALKRIMK